MSRGAFLSPADAGGDVRTRDRPEANAGHPAANGDVAVDAVDLVARAPRCSMTSNLRTLALDGARPVLVHNTDSFQALLFPGRAF
jgi:hypothetical protein